MDLKKVLDQTVRELKREVNKKVLKVPEIEQKVLEATSNEAWGPHGTLMADIAQASRNYNECQMIMSILWKRVNDTGKNWRHVYKALTVLEFLVAHGSERVIDELREHAYQISTLSDFQYVESSGKDQGINVRKKAQTLVALVNDKEKIREARQKAVANREKYRGVSSTGGIYKPSSYSSTGAGYGGDRYDDDHSTSRYGNRDDDRYGYSRDRDDYRSRDEDRHGRDVDDRYGREGDRYRDDYNGNYDQEEDRYSSRRGDRQLDKDRDRPSDDEDRYSSRSGGGRGDDYGHEDRRSDRRSSAARSSAHPSYEEVTYGGSDGRDSGGLAAAVARAAKPAGRGQTDIPSTTLDSSNSNSIRAGNQLDDFDDFDPRGHAVVASSVVPPSNDLFGQTKPVATARPGASGDDFFGQTGQVEPSNITNALPPASGLSSVPSIGSDLFGDSNFGSGFTVPPVSGPSAPNKQLNGNLFGDSGFEAEPTTSSNLFPATVQSSASSSAFMQTSFSSTVGLENSNNEGFNAFGTVTAKSTSATLVGTDPFRGDSFNAFGAVPAGSTNINSSPIVLTQVQHPSSVETNNALNAVQQVKPEQRTDKFETKSKVWADSLSKGLIDLNIAGPKSNPLAELGIDFDLLRTERKKEEKASTTTVKGKAMGSGSGIGLAGAGALAPPPGPAMMGGVGMGMRMGPGMAGMGMGPGMGMGMGPNMGIAGNPGMGMMTPMGMGPGSGMGMGMNPMMGMTMGGYLDQQQQYGGFR